MQTIKKYLYRLLYKKQDFYKVIHLEYSSTSVNNIVFCVTTNYDENPKVLKRLLMAFYYSEQEIKSAIEILTKKLEAHEKYRSERYKFFTQTSFGNWAWKNQTLESLKSILENQLCK